MTEPGARPELTVIMVNYNTRDLTLRAIETLLANAGDVAFRLVVWDNASHDGSADAIARRFPDIELIRSPENIGFARANNAVAASAGTEWLLLLNPDTETHPDAVKNLLTFARTHPEAGIVGGRTVFPDGSLNAASCWNRMTPWSLLCSAMGLSRLLPRSAIFNPEGIGGWPRDSVRHVDIVVGCFFLLKSDLWRALGGFNPGYFMYGEEADMCLRAARLGYRPMITPDAQIMHLVGASTAKREDKVVKVMKARSTLIRDHWSRRTAPLGLMLLWLWAANRRIAASIAPERPERIVWRAVWRRRDDWLAGYSSLR
ncbi:glycosyltransferase family 2 protein [Novosphingobium sp. ZN18A2]|uniref:glycosyltransferase family 2 protein n=1 Tax=Novosphingobium sp. ZN18A2 TaxID=3079861 RepID=UPI0030CF76FC